jgi:hypothetical protein
MTPRGIAATKGIKTTTDYTHLRQGYGGQARLHRWGKVWDGELRMNLNSGTHEQIYQPVSRQDAKGQGAEGECSRKTGSSRKAGRKLV